MMLFCIPFIFFCSWMMSDLTCTESRSQTSIGEKVNRAVLGVVKFLVTLWYSGIDGYCSGIDGYCSGIDGYWWISWFDLIDCVISCSLVHSLIIIVMKNHSLIHLFVHPLIGYSDTFLYYRAQSTHVTDRQHVPTGNMSKWGYITRWMLVNIKPS